MESVKPLVVTPPKGKLRRTFAKVLHIHKLTGVVPEDDAQKVKKTPENIKYDQDFSKNNVNLMTQSFDKLEEEFERRLTLEALIAKLFATVSSIKAAYAQLQNAVSPYDTEGIHKSDNLIVSELKMLSELKQCFLKKQFDPSPERTLVLAEIQELRSVLKAYDIMGKKLESQMKLKDSEIIFLGEKLEEHNEQNKLLEKKLNQSGQLCSVFNNLHISGLNPNHFITFLHHTIKSIRGFVKLMIEEMKLAGWDIDAAADSIQPCVFYYKNDNKCFAFEHFVCREMFEAFHLPLFSASSECSHKKKKKRECVMFFERFSELKSTKTREYLSTKPKSRFSRFCRAKYLQLIHPKMESAFFDNMNHRNGVMAGEFKFPEANFFDAFLEMAKRVWLLHCLAFSFDPEEASIFQVAKGCRFSEVYMKSVSEDAFLSPEPRVSFTVVPGFRIGKTLIQCEVYLSGTHESQS